jgi:hypothetical protein
MYILYERRAYKTQRMAYIFSRKFRNFQRIFEKFRHCVTATTLEAWTTV